LNLLQVRAAGDLMRKLQPMSAAASAPPAAAAAGR